MSSAERRSPPLAVAEAAGLGVAGLLVGSVVAVLLYSLAIGIAPPISESLPAQNVLMTFGQGVGIVAAAVFYLRVNDLGVSFLRFEWPGAKDVGWALLTTVALFALFVIGVSIADLIGLSPTEHSVADRAEEDPRVLLALVPAAVLVTGPAEELLYRGVVQSRLVTAFGTATAVAVASVIFALVHVPAYAAGAGLDASLLTTLALLFVLGAVLGAAYEYTGNLAVPMLAHGFYNAVVYGSSYLSAVA